MYYLLDDPTYPLSALGLAAVILLLMLRSTQQGKFLVWVGVVAAVALGLVLVERLVVTDAERVEAVVYDLADAVEHADTDRIDAHLAKKVTFGTGERTMDGMIPLKVVYPVLKRCRFDFVHIGHLTTFVAPESRRGKAGFTASTAGTVNESGTDLTFGAAGTEWELGFHEDAPDHWVVDRVTLVKAPLEVRRAFFGGIR